MKDNRDNKNGIVVLIIIILIAVLIAVFDMLSIFVFRFGRIRNTALEGTIARQNLDSKDFFGHRNRYVARIFIDGVIEKENETYNQSYLLDTINILKEDKKCRGIILYLDTPGGTVFEADELYLALMNYKSQTGRPIWAYQNSLCASGGYYISCAADKIFANRNTLTGSIGVIAGSSFDATGLLDKIGIKSKTIHSGRNKNMFNFNEPVTSEQEEIMQKISDEAYEQFVAIVATSRKIDLTKVKSLADGRIFTAKQALDCALIDEVGDYDAMCDQMFTTCFCDADYDIVDYKYEKPSTLRDILLTKAIGKNNALSAIQKHFHIKSLKYPAYLWE